MKGLVEEFKRLHRKGMEDFATDDRGIMSEIRLIGAGLILTLVVTLVIVEVHDVTESVAVGNESDPGPFAEPVSTVEGVGVSSLILVVVGLLVIAAAAIMRYFDGGFGGGGR